MKKFWTKEVPLRTQQEELVQLEQVRLMRLVALGDRASSTVQKLESTLQEMNTLVRAFLEENDGESDDGGQEGQ